MPDEAEKKMAASMLHCLEQISSSVKGMDESQRSISQPFFDQVLPDDKMLTRFVGACWFNFYHTFYDCDESARFPADCKYEVLIPTNQTNANAVQFLIVPAGSKTGDRVVVLLNFVPGPALLDVPLMEIFKDWSPDVRQTRPGVEPFHVKIKDNWIAAFADSIRDNGVKFAELQGKATVDYGVITLTDEPFIRMPCYNIPFQCAYRMAVQDVGIMTFDTADIWNFMKANELSGTSVHRTPPDAALFHGMLFWPFFEMMRFSPKERMGWLLVDIRKKEFQSKPAHFDGLYKRIRRYIDGHLKSEYSS